VLSGLSHQCAVFDIPLSFLSLGVFWDENRFYKLVQLVQKDIGKYRADDGTLWDPAECPVKFPILQVACVEQMSDEVDESSIVDVLAQR
jgi:hypothetical protein